MSTVALHVDPICPWSWITAQWLRDVEQVRDVEVEFRVMSLAMLNERRTDLPGPYRRMLAEGLGPVRVAVAVEERYGPADLRAFYEAAAQRHHNRNQAMDRDLLMMALREADLDPRLADAARDSAYDRSVRASHRLAIELAGDDAGTPVIVLDDGRGGPVAFFGPIVSPAPRGEAAGLLWDAISALATTGSFFELKRGRTRGPVFD